jgi:hypothetical protein
MSHDTRPNPFSLAWKRQSNAPHACGSIRLLFALYWGDVPGAARKDEKALKLVSVVGQIGNPSSPLQIPYNFKSHSLLQSSSTLGSYLSEEGPLHA